MSRGSNVNNSGIDHLALNAGGRPFCKNDKAHMSIATRDSTPDHRICKRCATKWSQMRALSAKTAAKKLEVV